MKQVLIYNQLDTNNHGAQRYINEELFNFFKCQIDISLYLGWKPEDIVLGTNFEFSYKGIDSVILENICDWSGFNNFWYGAQELIERKIIEENFWLHDHDCWPIRYFEFPKFEGTIAGCEYIGTDEWNCGSIYCKKDSNDLLKYIIEVLEFNKDIEVSSDEIIISHIRKRSPENLRRLFSSINTTYNVGVTHGQLRYLNAIKPVNVLSFNPGTPKGIERLHNQDLFKVIPKDILNIFEKYFSIQKES